ncbi:MAG: response regulator transcription factor [Anaerolineales bacterium]|jgi:DNA-binding NarL/FixJ family response regulator
MKTTKVMVVIESRFMGDIFTEILEDEMDISVTGYATTISQALNIVRDEDPDMALVSIHLPNALDLIRTLKEIAPAIKVLVLGLADDKNQVLRCVEGGAAGYILQDSSVHDLIESIRLAQRREARISTNVAAALFERVTKMSKYFGRIDERRFEENPLTGRETEVLDFVCQGFTNQEIASQMILEVGTVKNHVHNILKKLNVASREEAATYLAYMRR